MPGRIASMPWGPRATLLEKSTLSLLPFILVLLLGGFESPMPVDSAMVLRRSPLPYPPSSNAAERGTGVGVFDAPLDLSFVECAGTNVDARSEPSPAVLLLHGLDSSAHTWRTVQQLLPYPSVAADLRGCGRSPLGDPDVFSVDAVVEDVKRLVDDHPLLQGASDGRRRPIVIVGHSMGGRVAACFAAKYPGDVSALVVEDMDMRRRPASSNPIPLNEDEVLKFDRRKGMAEDVLDTFERAGYPQDMVSRWMEEGRINRIEGGEGSSSNDSCWYWSDVNPIFRLLCYRKFFDSDSGEDTWGAIANDGLTYPIYLMVADKQYTVCDNGSLHKMGEVMGSRVKTKEYLLARHSIHNSAQEDFVKDLLQIIHEVSPKTLSS